MSPPQPEPPDNPCVTTRALGIPLSTTGAVQPRIRDCSAYVPSMFIATTTIPHELASNRRIICGSEMRTNPLLYFAQDGSYNLPGRPEPATAPQMPSEAFWPMPRGRRAPAPETPPGAHRWPMGGVFALSPQPWLYLTSLNNANRISSRPSQSRKYFTAISKTTNSAITQPEPR